MTWRQIHVVGSADVSNRRPSTILARRSSMPHRTTASIVGLVVAPMLVTNVIAAVQARTRMVCVSAIDKNGGAVADLQASEFQVKEGGKTAEVLSARPATTPLRINLIVADGGTGAFQLAIATFLQKLLGR